MKDSFPVLVSILLRVLVAAAPRPGACGVVEEVIYSPRLPGLAEGRELLEKLGSLPQSKTRDNWLASLTDTVTHQGVAAVGAIPEFIFAPEQYRRVLLLDRVQDPGNVGTLLRACRAFGFDTVLALPGTADFFNPKADITAVAQCVSVEIEKAMGIYPNIKCLR